MDFVFSESDSESLNLPSITQPSLAPDVIIPQAPVSILSTPILQKIELHNQAFKDLFYKQENFNSTSDQPSDKTVFTKSTPSQIEHKLQLKNKRVKNDDPTSGDFLGPWAHYSGEELLFAGRYQEIDEEQKAKLAELEEKRQKKILESKDKPIVKDYEKTDIVINDAKILTHVDKSLDYQGRSIFDTPSDLKIDPNSVAYIPKKCKQTLAGHTKGVQCVKFHKDGHLMLSASLDHTVKIWDAVGTKKCIQTYIGHTNSVRDICWSMDCTSFLSCSYDRLIRHWDTETGKVLCTFTCRRIPYCVKFNPDPEKLSSFIVGTANKKIVEYDTYTGKKERTYDEHLGAVNSLCFMDNNKKFVSTSDDKKVFLWEFGIPIVAKHISEPNLHAIPYTVLHPNNRHFVGQCLDNRLVVFEARGGFRLNRRKKFVGHMNGGFACSVAFSPDGQFVTSGDANGRIWFWDWQTTKNYRTLQAHNDVVIGIDWHPVFPSVVATCSWDGVIKIWD